jgi:tRNA 2-thiouridine synthesizing protein A
LGRPGKPRVYDLKGLNCPLPVLKARKRLSRMRPGGRLWLETTDPLAVIDIPAFCVDEGHVLVESTAAPGAHRFLVERGEKKKQNSPQAVEPVSHTGVIGS